MTESSQEKKATAPEDLTRLFVEHANAKDAAAVRLVYEEQAVMAYPPGSQTVGRQAIRALWEKLLPPHAALRAGATAAHAGQRRHRAHATVAQDGTGARAQVARRQPDGSWLRLLDQPEIGR